MLTFRCGTCGTMWGNPMVLLTPPPTVSPRPNTPPEHMLPLSLVPRPPGFPPSPGSLPLAHQPPSPGSLPTESLPLAHRPQVLPTEPAAEVEEPPPETLVEDPLMAAAEKVEEAPLLAAADEALAAAELQEPPPVERKMPKTRRRPADAAPKQPIDVDLDDDATRTGLA